MVLPGVALMNICQLALFLPQLSAGKYRTHNKNSMLKGKDRNEHTQFPNFSPSFSLLSHSMSFVPICWMSVREPTPICPVW